MNRWCGPVDPLSRNARCVPYQYDSPRKSIAEYFRRRSAELIVWRAIRRRRSGSKSSSGLPIGPYHLAVDHLRLGGGAFGVELLNAGQPVLAEDLEQLLPRGAELAQCPQLF